MKNYNFLIMTACLAIAGCRSNHNNDASSASANPGAQKKYLFVDVHNLKPGSVKFADVAGAHQKDLATQKEFGVSFQKYWVDEAQGKIYCLAESTDSTSVYLTHKKAHGLVPDRVMKVSDGMVANANGTPLYFDVHYLTPGKVTPEDVAAAHVKDLAVQGKYNVNFINYWVDPAEGVVMCLANAPDSASMVRTHKEAHGLVPDEVHLVKQGQ